MMNALYTGATGLKTHGSGLQVVSNNIANVSTIGYKQQSALFQELFSSDLSFGNSTEISSQKGHGVRMGEVRSLFTEGAYEPGSAITDISIAGKGFFQVTHEGYTHYSRAGNFRFDNEGVLRDPAGFALTGISLNNGVEGALGPLTLNMNDEKFSQDPPKATTSMFPLLNIGSGDKDLVQNATDPYFALLSSYDGTKSPPFPDAGYTQALSYYDSEGNERTLKLTFDQATKENGKTVIEYVLAMPPEEDGRANAEGSAGAGLLMAGTLTFTANGELVDQSAFVPGEGDLKDLNNWTPAPLVAGKDSSLPQFTLQSKGDAQPQTISLNLGIGTSSGWKNGTGSAADVGVNGNDLPGMGTLVTESTKATAWPGSSSLRQFRQDGYGVGELSDVTIDDSGIMTAYYSNGQSHDIYRIPIYRVMSEDGLRREGNNHFSATADSGEPEHGIAGTENYGKVSSNKLESSNVDMSREMVNLIVLQRGFQSNSKSITTADTMLQRALELKR